MKTLKEIVLAGAMTGVALFGAIGCESTAAHFWNTLEPKDKIEYMWRTYKTDEGTYDGEVMAIWSPGNYWHYLPHGKGTWTDKEGWMYKGDFVKGERHGYGKFIVKDREVFVGFWDHNKFVGDKNPGE